MARPKRNVDRVRMNIEMPSEIKERIEQLRDRTSADSMSEVIRRALAVYEFIQEERSSGSTLFLRSSDGKEKQLELL